MFRKTAQFYDAIYSWKDYRAESDMLHRLIRQHKRSPGNTLLDVACGTGGHILYLREHYAVEGLDLDAEMLAVARQRFPDVTFHQADMVDFDLGRQFDVVTCLFNSIGYVQTLPRLNQSVLAMARHLKRGGVLIVEPWFTPETFFKGSLHAVFVDRPDLKLARMNISEVVEGEHNPVSILDFHYLIGTPEGISYITEHHEAGLFTTEQYVQAFREAGLRAIYDPDGLAPDAARTKRGLLVGISS
jgi:ubiquinone/menaquinone biosynthesis C-methylase UbiE